MFPDRIEAHAYSRSTEVIERVISAVLNIYPEDVRDSVVVKKTKTDGYAQIPIFIVDSVLSKKKLCEATFEHIVNRFSREDRGNLRRSLEMRLDENCVFFLRIDKQASFYDEQQLARNPDVISVQIHLRQYPRCDRDNALAWLGDYLNKE